MGCNRAALHAHHAGWDGVSRSLRPVGDGTAITYRGRRLLLMHTDDCLGLAWHPDVRAAAVTAIKRYGTGCAGSRFLNGSLDIHERLESKLAAFLGKEAAVLFPSGYQANLGCVAALVSKGDAAILDRDCASGVLDGGRLSLGRVHAYSHRDLDELEAVLTRLRGRGKLVVVDGVFQPQGDVPDLTSIYALCRTRNAGLLLNDTYGLGINGVDGSGTAEAFGLSGDVDVITGSFSRVLGAAGGFAVGSAEVIGFLKHHARSLIFSASLAPPNTAAALAAIDILQREPERRRKLLENSKQIAASLRRLGYRCSDGCTGAVSVYFQGDREAGRVWRCLLRGGVLTARYARTEPEREAVLKVSCSAVHGTAQMIHVVDMFARAGSR